MIKINLKGLLIGIVVFLGATSFSYAGQNGQPESTPERASQPSTYIVKMPAKEGLDQPALQSRYPRYRLRCGDVIQLKFPVTPELDQTVTVKPDGFITLLYLKDLRVEGKTESELFELLRLKYAVILEEPEIMVQLLDFEKPYFVAGGEVGHPGKYEMRGLTTVAQAVNISGGFTKEAKHSQVLLFRRVSDEWVQVTELDMKRMFNKGDLSEDPQLRPGDLVYIPKNFISKIKDFIPSVVWPIRPYKY